MEHSRKLSIKQSNFQRKLLFTKFHSQLVFFLKIGNHRYCINDVTMDRPRTPVS